MRPNAKWGLLGLGIVILALLLAQWFRMGDSNRVVLLKDGSTLRLLKITRGKTHGYTPPLWRKWLERFGWAEPYQGAVGISQTSPQPEMWVWLRRRLPSPNPNPWVIPLLPVRLVDSQGAYLPVEVEYSTILRNSRETIFAVRLPRLPSSERQVWLEFLDKDQRHRIPVPPPYLGSTAPSPLMQPQPLPVQLKIQEFEFELQKLAIVDAGARVFEDIEYPLLQIEPRVRFSENGRPSDNWVIEDYWFEDPYGNRYSPTLPPPWHYPYWLFCATVYPSYKASSISPRAWRSSWISRRRGADTPINETINRAGTTLELLGVFEYPQFTLQVDPTLPNKYRVLSHSRAQQTHQRSSEYGGISDVGKDRWQVRMGTPLLILRINLPLAGSWSSKLGKDGAFIFKDQAFHIFLQDERGRLHRAPVTVAEESGNYDSYVIFAELDPRALDSGRFRVIVDAHPPRTIRIPIAPLDKEQVLKMWPLQSWGRPILR